MTKESYLLNLEKVSFTWPFGEKVIDECDFSIEKQGFWMVVGSNGSGKSTLFRLISGLLSPQGGRISSFLKPALILQNPDHQLLLPSCSSDLLLSMSNNLSLKQKKRKIKDVLKIVGLEEMEFRPIHTLSGGQKQRLALAGALASDANLFLLDEPTALLDPSSQGSILETIQRLSNRDKNPITSLWITHRLEELASCNGAAVMKDGRVSNWFKGQDLLRRLN